MTKFNVLILDCDGVIFDVNRQKTEAFAEALSGCPSDRVAFFVKMHQETGGVSRYEKFRHFFTELHPVHDAETAIQHALNAYAAIVQKAYRELNPHPSAIKLCQFLKEKVPVFVASGSDEEELRAVFRDHEIIQYFAGVYGSPTKKIENIRKIMAQRNVAPEEVLFVGDGGGDYQATRALDVPFIYLGEMAEWEPSEEEQKQHPFCTPMSSWDEILEFFNVT